MIVYSGIRPPPLAASDLIVQDVLDQGLQDAADRGEPELQAMSLDRPAVMESKLEISHVEDIAKSRIVLVGHLSLRSGKRRDVWVLCGTIILPRAE